MALSSVGKLWKLARNVEDLFALNERISKSLEAIHERLDVIEKNIIRMDAEQQQVISEAKAAATAAAAAVAGAVISDNVTRITRMESRFDQLEQHVKALPAPE